VHDGGDHDLVRTRELSERLEPAFTVDGEPTMWEEKISVTYCS